MNKAEMQERLSAISKVLADLPYELDPSHISIDGYTEMNRLPSLSVWEKPDTAPNNFFEYADWCGKEVQRTSFTDTSDALWFVFNGVCLLLLVEKEVQHDEGADEAEKAAE